MTSSRLPKILGFFTPPAITCGAGEELVKDTEMESCISQPPLFNYALAEPLLKARMKKEPGLQALGESRVTLATALAMRNLNSPGNQLFDGFIPFDLVINGSSSYFGIEKPAMEEVVHRAIDAVRYRVSASAQQVVWLNFSKELSQFFPVPNKRFEMLQSEKQEQENVKQRVLEILGEIFMDYNIQFVLDERTAQQITNEYVTVNFVEKSQKSIPIYGHTITRDLLEPYTGNRQMDETIEVYLSGLTTAVWHSKQVKINPKVNKDEAEANMERLSQLIVYIVFHELMHTFGIPHLPNRMNREPYMMDRAKYSDLSPLWGSSMGKIEKEQLTTLKHLLRLTPTIRSIWTTS